MEFDFKSLQRAVDEATAKTRYYNDFSEVDPNTLHQISELLGWIRSKGSGAALREAVAQLFERYLLTATLEGDANFEVQAARGEFQTLSSRLSALTSLANQVESKLNKDTPSSITMKMLSQEVKTAMTGGSVAVVGTNAVSTSNIVDKSVTNEKLKGAAVQVHFLPDRFTNRVDLNTKSGTLNFGEDAAIYYNGKYLTIPKNSTIDLSASFTNSAGFILINLTTGDVSAQSMGVALPENSAVLGIVRRQEGKYTFTGSIASAIVEDGRLPMNSFVPMNTGAIYPSSNCLMNFNYETKSIEFIEGGFYPAFGGLLGDYVNKTITLSDDSTSQKATEYFQLTYNFETKECKIFGRASKLPSGFVRIGVISGLKNKWKSTDIPCLSFDQVAPIDTQVKLTPSKDGNPWYDTARNRIFWNCVTDQVFVKYNHRIYQLAKNASTDLSTWTATSGELYLNLSTGDVVAHNGFNKETKPGLLPLGRMRRQSDGVVNFYDIPIFQLGSPSVPVMESGSNGGTIAVAHRGYNRIAPENTADAYLLSRSYGSTVWETDVLFTSDGVPVCHHDVTINRVARNKDGSSLSSSIRLEDCTFEQLQEYDFGIYKNEYFAGTKILTFENWVKMANILGVDKLFIELKSATPRNWIVKMMDILKSWNMYDKACWLAFDWTNFTTISTLDEKTSFVFLNGRASKIDEMKQYDNGKRELWASPSHTISVEEAKALKNEGFKLYLWTLTKESDMNKFKDVYIDAVGFNGDINIANIQRRQIMSDSI